MLGRGREPPGAMRFPDEPVASAVSRRDLNPPYPAGGKPRRLHVAPDRVGESTEPVEPWRPAGLRFDRDRERPRGTARQRRHDEVGDAPVAEAAPGEPIAFRGPAGQPAGDHLLGPAAALEAHAAHASDLAIGSGESVMATISNASTGRVNRSASSRRISARGRRGSAGNSMAIVTRNRIVPDPGK